MRLPSSGQRGIEDGVRDPHAQEPGRDERTLVRLSEGPHVAGCHPVHQFVSARQVSDHVAEYDYSKYFENIDHDHLYGVLGEHFFVTEVEWCVIRGFIEAGPSAAEDYRPLDGPPRAVGIPQGTSISLFLANAAAWGLDRALEDHGVGFVRYADDTLIWSTDYGRITAAADILHAHAEAMRVPVNIMKSQGVRLLVVPDARSEMRSTCHVDYLGYRIGLSSISLKPENETKIRMKVQRLIFSSLLREPLANTQEPSRLGTYV